MDTPELVKAQQELKSMVEQFKIAFPVTTRASTAAEQELREAAYALLRDAIRDNEIEAASIVGAFFISRASHQDLLAFSMFLEDETDTENTPEATTNNSSSDEWPESINA